MIHFDLPKQKSSILKVIGVGGGGGNAVNHMYGQNVENVDFIICNTDAQALTNSKVPNKIQLGPHLTQGLGAGANPEIGKQACEESMDEIKRILEVNTKMAFITAGMGGGTGTGGAPIIAKACKELGVLTVGIVSTPFSNEGPKRMRHAEEGIRQLRENVDTLLVISNDKLRHQYGNLKVREAFSKADDILSTATKCITDVITSNGQINVDFADVCTVMRNGGVAILGSATAEGEDRALRAVESAVNSPLLNDNEIRGAKWILVNITSSEGDHEITMDEEDMILSYLVNAAGPDTDVIKGIGFDDSLGEKLGVTIIATGFEHKDPFKVAEKPKAEAKPVEKIIMTLGETSDAPKTTEKPQPKAEESDPFAPKLVEVTTQGPAVIQPTFNYYSEEIKHTTETENVKEETILHFELKTEVTEPVATQINKEENSESKNDTEAASLYGSRFLSKPSNIYANQPSEEPKTSTKEAAAPQPFISEHPELELKLVVKEETPEAANENVMVEKPTGQISVEDPAMQDDAEEQKRRAHERLQKLRNLSYNMNSVDAGNEFDTVPAYVRRNMELFGNTLTSVENFYSKYTVKADDNDKGQLSSINTFLDGKKPD